MYVTSGLTLKICIFDTRYKRTFIVTVTSYYAHVQRSLYAICNGSTLCSL